jgi:hypothetical protein
MDARMIMQIDDDSAIVENFGSFPVFVDKTLSTWIRGLLRYKETENIITNRLKIQEELVELLQEYLKRYGVKVIMFLISYVDLSPVSARNEEQHIIIKDAHIVKNISDMKYELICKFLGSALLLLVLLSVAILFDPPSRDTEGKIPITWGTIISFIVIIMGIYQYFEIRKIRQIASKEE